MQLIGLDFFFTRADNVPFRIKLKCQENNTSSKNAHPNEGGRNFKYIPPYC